MLFDKTKIRKLELDNRIVMAPMCMFMAKDGIADEWHFVHYSTRAMGKTGLIITEATAVSPEGRIREEDLGIWDDIHIEGLEKICQNVHKLGGKIGIQLAHAGRKSEVKNQNPISPGSAPFDEFFNKPRPMTIEDIKRVVNAFGQGARRANEAGFDVIEIHGAHGYLINQFISPLTNKRNDEYGGSLENRQRFLLQVIKEIRKYWPDDKALCLRVSAEEYDENGNSTEDICKIINNVKKYGLDIIDVSSGGVAPNPVPSYPGYQMELAKKVRELTKLPVIGGGLITEGKMAEDMLKKGKCDYIYFGRELLRNPYFPLEVAKKLNIDINWPKAYSAGKL